MQGYDRSGQRSPSSNNLGVLASGCLCVLGVLAWCLTTAPVGAQGVNIPNFWDPRSRAERPDLGTIRSVRLITDDEFPPLHFAGPEGRPTGFAVEIARAACEKLAVACTIQARPFETLLTALDEKAGDAIVAAIPITADLRQRYAVTAPYFKTPARFAARKDRNLAEPVGAALKGRTIGVIAGTAHEVFAQTFMPGATLRGFPDPVAAQNALRGGEVEYLFGDGLTLALWVGGTEAADCCTLVGGPYLHPRFFGEGIGFVMRKEDDLLRRAFDHAFQRLWDEGKYAELYLRFFPVSPF